METEFKGTFIGRESVINGKFKVYNNILYIQKRHLIYFTRWIPVLGNAVKYLEKYTGLKLLSPIDGLTQDEVRIYWFDLHTCEEYYPRMNSTTLRALESLRLENDYNHSLMQDIKENLQTAGSEDQIREAVARQHKYITNVLKPPFMRGGEKTGQKKK